MFSLLLRLYMLLPQVWCAHCRTASLPSLRTARTEALTAALHRQSRRNHGRKQSFPRMLGNSKYEASWQWHKPHLGLAVCSQLQQICDCVWPVCFPDCATHRGHSVLRDRSCHTQCSEEAWAVWPPQDLRRQKGAGTGPSSWSLQHHFASHKPPTSKAVMNYTRCKDSWICAKFEWRAAGSSSPLHTFSALTEVDVELKFLHFS